MLKKTVNYTDFDGNERTETLYFNLTQTELIDMAMNLPGGVTETVGNDPDKIDTEAAAVELMNKLGGHGIINFIKEVVLKSYGVKSEDGRRFIKKPELTEEFSQTLAYDAIIMEFMTNDVAAAEFINKIIPANVLDKMTATMKGNAQLPKNS